MPPIDRSFPAETLKRFRAWLGLSQDDVASILGISTRSVQTYEGQGGPEWMRYSLLGWAVLVHGATPRAAARKLELPWEHHPLPGNPTDDLEAERPAEAQNAPPDPGSDADENLDADVDDAPALNELADAETMPTERRRER